MAKTKMQFVGKKRRGDKYIYRSGLNEPILGQDPEAAAKHFFEIEARSHYGLRGCVFCVELMETKYSHPTLIGYEALVGRDGVGSDVDAHMTHLYLSVSKAAKEAA